MVDLLGGARVCFRNPKTNHPLITSKEKLATLIGIHYATHQFMNKIQ
jgi:hypothetical protein